MLTIHDCELREKDSQGSGRTHQMMVQKLMCFNSVEDAKWSHYNLQLLEETLDGSLVYKSIRIPRFSYDIQGTEISYNIEWLYGTQGHVPAFDDRHFSRIYKEMVMVEEDLGFCDYNLDNFILGDKDMRSDEKDQWDLGYVDLEGFYVSTQEDRQRDFFRGVLHFSALDELPTKFKPDDEIRYTLKTTF